MASESVGCGAQFECQFTGQFRSIEPTGLQKEQQFQLIHSRNLEPSKDENQKCNLTW